ncbi:MAG: hypothetical protein V1809_14485 [Planctomycetota bacterium]
MIEKGAHVKNIRYATTGALALALVLGGVAWGARGGGGGGGGGGRGGGGGSHGGGGGKGGGTGGGGGKTGGGKSGGTTTPGGAGGSGKFNFGPVGGKGGVRSTARPGMADWGGMSEDVRVSCTPADFIRGWHVAGVFLTPLKEQLEKVFPPEEDVLAGTPDLRKMYEVSAGKVPFRRVSVQPHVVNLLPMLSAKDMAVEDRLPVVYAVTWVESTEDRPAVLHLGTFNAFKAWVNGKPAGDRSEIPVDGSLASAPDKSLDIALEKGANVILLRLLWKGEGLDFWAFLADDEKRPLTRAKRVKFLTGPPPPSKEKPAAGAGAPADPNAPPAGGNPPADRPAAPADVPPAE